MTNHVVGNCYRLIGFLADFKLIKNMRNQAPAPTHCNAAHVAPEQSIMQSGQNMEGSSLGNIITQEQYSQLFQLLQEVKIGQQNDQVIDASVSSSCVGIITPRLDHCSFSLFSHTDSLSSILDSGASEHMTYDSSLLFNIALLPITLYVKLSNSHKLKVTHKGSVTILLDLTLHNVLFVPDFKFSLLSVHKFTTQLNCLLIFYSLGAIL